MYNKTFNSNAMTANVDYQRRQITKTNEKLFGLLFFRVCHFRWWSIYHRRWMQFRHKHCLPGNFSILIKWNERVCALGCDFDRNKHIKVLHITMNCWLVFLAFSIFLLVFLLSVFFFTAATNFGSPNFRILVAVIRSDHKAAFLQ